MGQRILGIDPGSVITGYAVIAVNDRQPRLLVADCIRLGRAPLPDRLAQIYHALCEVIAEFQPDVMAVEEVFVSKNPASAIKLGQARGAAICAGAAHAIELAEYAPRRIKQAIVGKGGADKRQVQHMVRVLLGLQSTLQADAADAAAVALCHHHHAGNVARMQIAARG